MNFEKRPIRLTSKLTLFSIIAGVFFALGIQLSVGAELDTERELRHAVSSMKDWLGGGKKARRWRQILGINLLEAQSALGHRADYQCLQDIHRRFNSNVSGLQHPMFRRVSKAIEQHLQQLITNRNDVLFSAQNAKSEFQLVTLSDLNAAREDA
ncbi:MAG: hypothetical protein AAGA30_15075, partial [Planctomycetota bacterium]